MRQGGSERAAVPTTREPLKTHGATAKVSQFSGTDPLICPGMHPCLKKPLRSRMTTNSLALVEWQCRPQQPKP